MLKKKNPIVNTFPPAAPPPSLVGATKSSSHPAKIPSWKRTEPSQARSRTFKTQQNPIFSRFPQKLNIIVNLDWLKVAGWMGEVIDFQMFRFQGAMACLHH